MVWVPKKFKLFNLCLALLLFILFLGIAVKRYASPRPLLSSNLIVMNEPLSEESTRESDPLKEMEELVYPQKETETQEQIKLQDQIQSDRIEKNAARINIDSSGLRYQFNFHLPQTANLDLLIEVFDIKKEYLFSFFLNFETELEQSFFVEFPEAQTYYFVASHQKKMDGTTNTSSIQQLQQLNHGMLNYTVFKNTYPYLSLFIAAILFGLLALILFKNYKKTKWESFHLKIRFSIQKPIQAAKDFFSFIWRNPYASFQKLTLFLPFLIAVILIFSQLNFFEKKEMTESLAIAPIPLESKALPYLNYYAKKITISDTSESYKLKVKVPVWEKDFPSGDCELAVMNENAQRIAHKKLSFYYYETCCDSEGDDYNVSNYSDKLLIQFPKPGTYFIYAYIPYLLADSVNTSAYNIFKDMTGGELFLSVYSKAGFGERPFNGILYFLAAFFIVIGLVMLHYARLFWTWINYVACFISLCAILIMAYFIFHIFYPFHAYYLWFLLGFFLLLVFSTVKLMRFLQFILSLIFFALWTIPWTIFYGLGMALLFAGLPIAGLAFFFVGIFSNPADNFLTFTGAGMILAFVLWIQVFRSIRKKKKKITLYGDFALRPLEWVKKILKPGQEAS